MRFIGCIRRAQFHRRRVEAIAGPRKTERVATRFNDGVRHSVGWYDQSGEAYQLADGDQLFIPCEGGPCKSRLEVFPPRLEIEEAGGTYVLVDDGTRERWHYVFIPGR